MKNNRTAYIVTGIAVLGGLFLFWWFSERDARYNWSETFETEGEEPYDLNIFAALLEDWFPEKGFHTVTDFKTDTAYAAAEGANLIYIAGRAYIDSAEAERIKAFAERGNRVFISAANQHLLTDEAAAACGATEPGKWLQRRKAKRVRPYITFGVDSASADFHYQVADKVLRYPWAYFDLEWCESDEVRKAGGFEAVDRDFINYITVNAGEGLIMLHTVPHIFSNYHIIRPEVPDHIEAVLGLLNEGDIYYADLQFETARQPNRPLLTESPLRFILGNESLRWAWYITLILALIFVLNAVRRRERKVPVIIRPQNDSLRFLDVTAQMYRKEGKHKHILALQTNLLTERLRTRYGISKRFPDKGYAAEVSYKLDMPREETERFFMRLYRASHDSTLDDKTFIEIDRKITEFYAKCP